MLKRAEGSRGTGLVRDDEAGRAQASSSERLQPVTEDAVSGFLTDVCCGNGMRAGSMTNGEAFGEFVAALQLMNGRERADRGERAQRNQRPGARLRTEPLQHLDQGYAHSASCATALQNGGTERKAGPKGPALRIVERGFSPRGQP